MLFPPNVIAAAVASEKSSKCPAVITLAQWALESGYGKYSMGANNYFGIKWHKDCGHNYIERPTHEVYNGRDVTISAKFIRFASMQDCFEYHGRLVFQGPYAHCIECLKPGWRSFLHCFAHIYATDPQYEQKLLQIIQAHDLERLVAGA